MFAGERLGWFPDPEGEADTWPPPGQLTGADASEPPPSASVEDALPKLADQVLTNSCVGQGFRVMLATEEQVRTGKHTPTSALSHYFLSRAEHGMEDWDVGTYPGACARALERHGIIAERDWPFDPKRVNTRPSWRAQQLADGTEGMVATPVYGYGDERLRAIRKLVASRRPVGFGTVVYKGFGDPNGPSVIDRPHSGEVLGGHFMVIVGYDGALFRVANSYGTYWRDRGLCWMTEDYIAWASSQNFYVCLPPWVR